MIKINDNDLPITVAEKLITGKRPYEAAPVVKAVAKAVTGKDPEEEVDMFSDEELKEIAQYLWVYVKNHEGADI